MEKHKHHYLQVLLDRKSARSSTSYKKELENGGEPQALHCYVDTIKMNLDSFVDCLVHDGLFMIELFRRKKEPTEYVADLSQDKLFNIKWMKARLARDMLLFENQIPLFVLFQLSAMIDERPSAKSFVELALEYFEFSGRRIQSDRCLEVTGELDKIPHLLGLVYNALVLKADRQQKTEVKSCESIWTAVALKEVGVTFSKADANAAFYVIGFSNGLLSIPSLEIDDNTESLFRNLVAYEQYSKHYSLHRVVDYLHVMDCLINSAKDVELLRHCGIIDNKIGDDEKVAIMFNRLCSGVYFDKDEFYYAKMFDEVNKFCKNPWNMRISKLKNDSFGSPWSIISFIAASLLLVLTVLQTGYTIASYYQSKS